MIRVCHAQFLHRLVWCSGNTLDIWYVLQPYNPRWEIMYYLGGRIQYDPPLWLLVLMIFAETGYFGSIMSEFLSTTEYEPVVFLICICRKLPSCFY
jgi:hypothetical protein